MPRDKDLKRLVRTRMKKTGEAYTSARSSLLKAKQPQTPSPEDYARLAGMTNEAVKAKTGCAWDRWVHALDKVKAMEMSHREIADHIYEKYEISGWWAQTVAVGYERIKGLREIGQRRDGAFEANKSKTIAAPLARLYAAFSQKRVRDRWLGDVDMRIKTSTPEKSMRISWRDSSAVDVYFTGKDKAKSQVAIQHRKLPTREAAESLKTFWAERLTALNDVLTS